MKTTNYLLQSVYPDGCSRRKNRHYWRSNLKTKTNRAILEALTTSYNGGFEFKDGVKQANEYAYDANGNLTKDLNKNISSIQYNCLNLPSAVTFADGSTITYTYAADGTKLRVVHKIGSTTTTTDYCGNVVYENGTPKYLLTEEGYVTFANKKYHYFLKDHQGNNRVVIDQSGAVEEVNHYYPFGGTFASTSVQPYKYNGKEYDDKKGLNWYDYGARHYDAAIGRFTTVDPMAENAYSGGPYTYCLNNPVIYIDTVGTDTVPANEIWDYDLINFSSTGTGMHKEAYIPVIIDGTDKYHLHEITSGENKGNYIAIEQLGIDKESGINMYEYRYIVGKEKLDAFRNGETDATGLRYNLVRFAADNGVDGNKTIWENMRSGYQRIVTDPMNWLPNPLDPTNLIPQSFYKIKPWNRFLMETRGKYTKQNYDSYQQALKQRSIDYQKWKQKRY